METSGSRRRNRTKAEIAIADAERRAITYSMDALIPGLYVWLGSWTLRLGGSLAEDTYSGTLHSSAGIALVLPGYRIYSSYQGSYDPGKEVAWEKLQAHKAKLQARLASKA